jgi:hypothetical protein
MANDWVRPNWSVRPGTAKVGFGAEAAVSRRRLTSDLEGTKSNIHFSPASIRSPMTEAIADPPAEPCYPACYCLFCDNEIEEFHA